MRQFSCGYFLLWIACQEDISHRVWENVAFLIPCFKATIFLHIITHSHALQFSRVNCVKKKKKVLVQVLNRKYSRFFIKMHTSPADYLTWGVGQDFFLPLKKIQFSVSLKVHLENNLQTCEYAMISKKKSVLDVTQRPRLNSM